MLALCKPERGPSPELNCDLGLLGPRAVGNTFLLFLSPPVRGHLLLQPGRTGKAHLATPSKDAEAWAGPVCPQTGTYALSEVTV